MKSFYNKHGALNATGSNANSEVYHFMDDFFTRWIAMGYDIREIQGIITDEVVSLGALKRLTKAMTMRKEEKNDTN